MAEKRPDYLAKMADEYNLLPENCFTDWRDLIEKGIEADGVVIATQDAEHKDPAMAFSEKRYNILLEKPMSNSEQECRDIVKSAIDNEIIFAVCHVLRYTSAGAKVPCTPVRAVEVIRKLTAKYADARPDTTDGLRLDWDDAWVLIRGSNTEPIVRVFAEALEQKRVDALVAQFAAEI